MNGEKSLSIEGLMSSSQDLNNASSQLKDVCTQMYSVITALRESETFKTVVASSEYFGNIDNLNQIVPKYEEAILKFSQFLSNYVLQNYTETDEETKAKIESNLAESISQLSALGVGGESGGVVDYSKISSTASGALAGDFIDSSKIRKSAFEDGELEFFTRPDGSVQIVKNGTVLGYTTKDGIGNAQTTTSPSTDATSNLASGAAASATLGATAAGSSSISIPEEYLARGYTGKIYTKSYATDEVKASTGTITTGNQSYIIVPDSQYTKAPGTISESDYHLLIAQVAGESGNSKDDMLGVTCTVLNRLEAGGKGDSVTEVLEKGYFPWGETHLAYEPGGKFYNTDWGQAKLAQVTEVVNDALGGVRNLEEDVYYYSGNHTHDGELYNHFSDVV